MELGEELDDELLDDDDDDEDERERLDLFALSAWPIFFVHHDHSPFCNFFLKF